MSRRITFLFFSFVAIVSLLIVEMIYLAIFHSLDEKDIQMKSSFSRYIGLPNLAITNTPSLRHASLNSVFDIYSLDPVLREYDKGTYVIFMKKDF